MKKQRILLVGAIIFLLSCQFLTPANGDTVIYDCRDLVAAMGNLHSGDIPEYLIETGKKHGGEFDVNEYFTVLTHLSMQEGYALDYVYLSEGIGGSPSLYARPVDQTPYASIEDVPKDTVLPDFHEYLEIEDSEQGYFEYVVMDLLARQFYLYWHANYNDTQIVCDRGGANAIIDSVNSSDFGYELDLSQQMKARAIKDIEPVVTLKDDSAVVQVITFTKWGGFYRLTYSISRSFPHTITDVKEENLIPYDCGVMF